MDIANGKERQKRLNETVGERYDLAKGRIKEIPEARLLQICCDILDRKEAGTLYERTLEECRADNAALYEETLPGRYEKSLLDPAFATRKLGPQNGSMAALLSADFLGCIPYAFRGDKYQLTLFLELLIQIYSEVKNGFPFEEIKEDIYWFYHDNCGTFVEDSIRETIDPSLDHYKKILMEADLDDPAYLYRYGIFIGENELRLSEYLSSLSETKIDAMAGTLVDGFFRGFAAMRKDIGKKKTVKVEFPVGLERVSRRVVQKLEGAGLTAMISGDKVLSLFGIGGRKYDVYGTSLSPQFEFDHRNDRAFYYDKKIAKRMLDIRGRVLDKMKDEALDYAGPLLTEVFGMEKFPLVSKNEAIAFSEKQRKVSVWYQQEALALANRYMPQDERSYSIISYPLPSIGPDFEKIFSMTMEVNTLPGDVYQKIQQNIIDVLDRGRSVHIKGARGNETELNVSLHDLEDGQTNFENCVADVNIPVGEVFTSPVLKGTDGMLHVSEVYLKGMLYKDLKITFKDGMITSYTCRNFENEEDNKKLILEDVLYFHDSLPMGEFAIGTNTVAYTKAKRYGILGKLPILIAEKCGPHFAVGDTCYSYEEDSRFYNPDGKEIIAKENEVSAARKDDPSNAYFSCHTDITIPYEEIGVIEVILPDGKAVPVIEDGRFVVPGTELLNKPFDEAE